MGRRGRWRPSSTSITDTLRRSRTRYHVLATRPCPRMQPPPGRMRPSAVSVCLGLPFPSFSSRGSAAAPSRSHVVRLASSGRPAGGCVGRANDFGLLRRGTLALSHLSFISELKVCSRVSSNSSSRRIRMERQYVISRSKQLLLARLT